MIIDNYYTLTGSFMGDIQTNFERLQNDRYLLFWEMLIAIFRVSGLHPEMMFAHLLIHVQTCFQEKRESSITLNKFCLLISKSVGVIKLLTSTTGFLAENFTVLKLLKLLLYNHMTKFSR